ncbi:MAG: NRDE family protein [Halobacteriales archaeon]|nr:NRDE family protein [Halobacteriales archaeon]
MCTIIFAHGVFDGFTLASNRDESYGRGFSPPKKRETEDGWMVAPRDDRAGGTWIGFNDDGVVVTLANLPVYYDEARSRGKLCDDLLRASSVDEARALLRDTYARHEYEGFNVVVGSSEACFVGVNDGDLRLVEADEGVNVVTNSAFDDPAKKAERVADAVPSPYAHETARDWLEATRPLLADHETGVCVHDEENRRGTTSSNLLYVAPEEHESSWLFADGAPCETPYETVFPVAD